MDQKKKNKGLSELIDAACSFKKQLEQLQKDLKLNNCFSQIVKLQTDYQRQTGQLQLPTTYFMALEAHKRVNPLFEMVKRTLGAPLDQFKEAAEALAKQNFAIQSSFREKLLQALPETYEASGALKEAQSV